LDHLTQVCVVLRKESLYAKPKKCTFLTDQVIFLGVVISSQGISADPDKIKTIVEWPESRNIREVRSIHGLATFYRRFIQNFRTIMTPITDCLKKEEFEWTKAATKAFQEIKERMTEEWTKAATKAFQEIKERMTEEWTKAATKAFQEIKERMTEAPVMRLSDFMKFFEITCDASGIGIGSVLSQEKHHVAYFSEKLNDARQRYSTYDKEFYAVVQALRYWHHYLLLQEFVVHSDHEALKYLNSQKKLNSRHGRWVKFLQACTYVLKHEARVKNRVVDALSRRRALLSVMSTEVVDFEKIKNTYESCPDFRNIYSLKG